MGESKDVEIAEELLKFFVNISDKECFCATLYTCYDLIRPDVVMEVAWRNQLVDFAMPFMIQYVHEVYNKMKELDERTATKKGEEEEEEEEGGMMDAMGNQVYMLTNTPYMQQPTPQMYQQQPQQQYMPNNY